MRQLTLREAAYSLLAIVLSTTLVLSCVKPAAADINKTLSFQGRLLNATGGVVPDGHYNIQFKLYTGGDGQTAGNPSGTLSWTETYVNNNANAGVTVKNGYFSAELGSQNPLTGMDWNSDTLWLSMNIAGSANACTTFGTAPCAADGEMVPMRRLTSSPYAMNAGAIGGKTIDQLLQLGQGVQTDASTSSSVFVNKTGPGNLIQMQNTGQDVFTVTNSGDIAFGNGSNHVISIDAATDTDANGSDLTINAGAGNGNGSNGNLYLGDANTATIQIGSSSASETQTITIGTNDTAGSITDVTIGAGSNAAGGSTTIQSKDNTSISTNGVTRAVFDTNGNLTLGNGVSSNTPTDFTIQGTASTATGVNGSNLSVQGGGATVGDANGGNLLLSGGNASGSGTKGLVIIDTPTYTTASTQSSAVDTVVTQSNIDSFGIVSLNATAANLTFTMNGPTQGAGATGRIVYVTPAATSYTFTLKVNAGGANEQLISLTSGNAATLLWTGASWVNAGASSPASLQSAYANTVQNTNGGAELIVGDNPSADGLTIRDSSTSPLNNSLLEVQSSNANTLFSVKSSVNDLASNPGAETAGNTSATFPVNSWSTYSDATVSRYTKPDSFIKTGRASVSVDTTSAQSGAKNTLTKPLQANTSYTVSTDIKLKSGSFTDLTIAYASDGTTVDATCVVDVTVPADTWKKVTCNLQTPASGITSNNALLIGQTGASSRTFYIDNLSIVQAGDSLLSDGGANDSVNFSTNWSAAAPGATTISRDTSIGYKDSTSVKTDISTGASYAGIRNKLATVPQAGKTYKISIQGAADTAFDDFTVRYSPDGGSHFIDCKNYSTHTISTANWSNLTCSINTGTSTPSDPYLYFVEAGSQARVFYLDDVSMTLSADTTSSVKVGNSDTSDDSPTLFTVDKSASAPTASDDEALLGSMYYDTTLGKLQCFQADGWGACGDRPDTFIALSPEYANAVMNGTDTGDISSGLCSDSLNINDGSSSQPTICGVNETYNFYHWKSAEVTDQTKSIFVTYQLPDTFKKFVPNSTSLMSRTDSSDATVSYQVYRNDGTSGLTACGTEVTASTGVQTAWNKAAASSDADPSNCDFKAGDSIVIRINLVAKNNANAYVSTLGFTYSSN